MELDTARRAQRLLELAQRCLAALAQDAHDPSPKADQRRAACAAWAERTWHASEGEEPRNNRTGLVLSAIEATAREQTKDQWVYGVLGRLEASFNLTLADRLREEPGQGLIVAAVEAWAKPARPDGTASPKWPASLAVLEHLFPGEVPKDLPATWRKWKAKRHGQ